MPSTIIPTWSLSEEELQSALDNERKQNIKILKQNSALRHALDTERTKFTSEMDKKVDAARSLADAHTIALAEENQRLRRMLDIERTKSDEHSSKITNENKALQRALEEERAWSARLTDEKMATVKRAADAQKMHDRTFRELYDSIARLEQRLAGLQAENAECQKDRDEAESEALAWKSLAEKQVEVLSMVDAQLADGYRKVVERSAAQEKTIRSYQERLRRAQADCIRVECEWAAEKRRVKAHLAKMRSSCKQLKSRSDEPLGRVGPAPMPKIAVAKDEVQVVERERRTGCEKIKAAKSGDDEVAAVLTDAAIDAAIFVVIFVVTSVVISVVGVLYFL